MRTMRSQTSAAKGPPDLTKAHGLPRLSLQLLLKRLVSPDRGETSRNAFGCTRGIRLSGGYSGLRGKQRLVRPPIVSRGRLASCSRLSSAFERLVAHRGPFPTRLPGDSRHRSADDPRANHHAVLQTGSPRVRVGDRGNCLRNFERLCRMAHRPISRDRPHRVIHD